MSGWITALAALVATGCVTVPAQEGVPSTASADATPATAGSASSLSADVLYKLLVAEFAGRRGQLELALENYLSVARQTGDAEAAERAVRIAMFARDQDRGLQAAELWTRLAPDSIDARQVHTVLLIRSGDIERAVQVLDGLVASIEAESPGEGLRQVGDMLSRERDREASIQVMERLVADRAEDPKAQYALGYLLARANEFDRAREALERVLALEPGNQRATVLHARVLQQQGDLSQALETLAKALVSQPDADTVRLTYARLLVEAKRFEEALEEFERLARDDPSNEDVKYAFALLLLQTQHLDRAEVELRDLINSVQRRYAAYYYLGQIAEKRKDLEQAVAAYRKVDRGDHRLTAQLRVAVLLADQDRLEQARAHLHGLHSSNTREAVRIYRAEAEILIRFEQLTDAMQVYDASLDEFPQDTDLLYARAMLAEKLDDLSRLEQDLLDILSREPNNADALNALGYTLADRTERLDEAYELIKRAYDLKPDDNYIVDSMGWVMYRMGRHQEALKHLRRAMEINADPEIAAHLGEVLWVMGNEDEAQEVWDTALKSTPDDKRLLDIKKRFGL